MDQNELVSVIICVYNAGEYFLPSLESVVNQTYRNLEIMIIDDGSTDGCLDTARHLLDGDPRIRLFNRANGGKSSALNFALERITGEYFAIHDADDISYPNRIETQAGYLRAKPDVAGVFCGYDLIIGKRRIAPHCEEKDAARCDLDIRNFAMPGHDPTAMYRSSMVRGFRFSEELTNAEGLDFILRVGERFKFGRVAHCLYGYRIHPTSITKRNPVDREANISEVFRRACARRGLDFGKVFPEHETWLAKPKKDNGLMNHFVGSAQSLKENGHPFAALRTALYGIGLRPGNGQSWKALAYALMPRALVPFFRKKSPRAAFAEGE